MKWNWFAGGRRAALVLGVALVAGCIAYAALSDIEVALANRIHTFGTAPVLVDQCGLRDARKELYVGAGREDVDRTAVTLCFKPTPGEAGQYWIPYRYAVSQTNAAAAPLYAARGDALARGDTALASAIAKQILALPVDNVAERSVWSASESDVQVRNYFDEVAAAFRHTPEGIARIDQLRSAKRWELWKQAGVVMVSGLVIGWLLVIAIGWIARGLLGIPRGKDTRL